MPARAAYLPPLTMHTCLYVRMCGCACVCVCVCHHSLTHWSQVFNNGHTIQVQWLDPVNSSVKIQTTNNTITDVLNVTSNAKIVTVEATPLQFHFHTMSEHAIEGMYVCVCVSTPPHTHTHTHKHRLRSLC